MFCSFTRTFDPTWVILVLVYGHTIPGKYYFFSLSCLKDMTEKYTRYLSQPKKNQDIDLRSQGNMSWFFFLSEKNILKCIRLSIYLSLYPAHVIIFSFFLCFIVFPFKHMYIIFAILLWLSSSFFGKNYLLEIDWDSLSNKQTNNPFFFILFFLFLEEKFQIGIIEGP